MEDELVVGLVFRGPANLCEGLIKQIEREKGIRLHYVKRTTPDRFLFILETGGKKNDRPNK